MEHVESALGVYLSTGGFLSLLKSLFRVGGCPAKLGSNWRLRTGCAPYIEYVINLVLPRATGKFRHFPPLPFRTCHDKNALLALAYEVVETVVSTYSLPTQKGAKGKIIEETGKDALSRATLKLGHASLASHVVAEPVPGDPYPDLDGNSTLPRRESNPMLSAPGSIEPFYPSRASTSSSSGEVKPDVPPAKSPGLTVLAAILSSTNKAPRDSVIAGLRAVDPERRDCIDSDVFALAYSLYVAQSPSFSSAKKGSSGISSSLPVDISLDALQPVPTPPTSRESIEWKERSVLSILRILCGVVVREDALREALSANAAQASLVPVLQFQDKSKVPPQPSVLDLSLRQLSQHIVSADGTTSVVSEIIDAVPCRWASSGRSVHISTAAAALIFHLEHDLGPQRGFDLLCRRRDGRFRRIAHAFGNRLIVSVENVGSEQGQLTQLILDRLLKDLRNPSTRDESLVRTLLGLPSASSGGLWTPDSPQSVAPKDCFDAILKILQRDCLKFSWANQGMASACYEVIFRLCRLTGNDFVGLRGVAYAAERLRSMDFWRSHLLSRIMTMREVVVHSDSITMDGIHSFAWILKGVAEEFRLLADLFAERGLQRLFQRQPTRFRSLLQALIDPQYRVISSLMSILPMEKPHFTATIVPSAESIRYSTYKIRGSPDVVNGFELVDVDRLCANAKVEGKAEEGGVRAWANQWNTFVLRDCASSHLTYAIEIAVGAASVASMVLAPHLSKNAEPWLGVLSVVLGRMCDPMEASRSTHSLDDTFFPTSTRNIARAILMISDLALLSTDWSAGTRGDISRVCLGVARLISFSGNTMLARSTYSWKTEQTAVLSCVLARLLPSADLDDDGLSSHQSFLDAAAVLSKLAIHNLSGSIPHVPQTDALVARSCLTRLFGLFSTGVSDIQVGEALCRSFLTALVDRESGILIADALISCIPLLDADIASLLATIAAFHCGREILIERRILESLHTAAECYVREEEKFRNASAQEASFRDAEIDTPEFFEGHIRLMLTLMLPKHRKGRDADNVAAMVARTLHLYSPVIERLTAMFPREGDILDLVVKCFAQLNLSATRSRSLAGQQISDSELQFDDELQTRVCALAIHISENPLPYSGKRALPPVLVLKESLATGTAVATQSSATKTWWDGLDLGGKTKEEVYKLSSLGLGMAQNGLCGLHRSHHLFLRVDVLSLLRVVCRCVDAIRVRICVYPYGGVATGIRLTHQIF